MKSALPFPSAIGRYRVQSELGRGAMGQVLLAHDSILSRNVAIKLLRPDLELKRDELPLLHARIGQEAKAVARLAHPGIVLLYDLGEDAERGIYLVFEHASGPTLENVLQRGRLTREGVARLAEELGAALTFAHARGIVHRDIKPSNIILTEEGAKIADFGVARLPESTLTHAGARVGTPAYSAPESLAQGEHSALSDQFSLAATLYEALAGTRAFPGDDAVTVARAIEREKVLPIAHSLGLRDDVDRVLLRALSRVPSERYPSCRDFGLALSRALVESREQQPTLMEGAASFEAVPPRPSTSHRVGYMVLWFMLGAAAVLVLQRLTAPPETQKKSGARTDSISIAPR